MTASKRWASLSAYRMFDASGSGRPKAGEITLLDVREAAEVQASGTAAGALHIPLAMVPLKADPTAPDRP